MAVEKSLQQASLSLYYFLCQHIVGTEETVRKIRMMIKIRDNVLSNEEREEIISGSIGEGLNMKGSDEDVMIVDKHYIVHDDTRNVSLDPRKIHLVMDMNDTKPGFTRMQCIDFPYDIMDMCIFNSKSWYLSSDLWKSNLCMFARKISPILVNIHGPCLSDKDETLDVAFCLHNSKWVCIAEEWINRPNRSWPSSDVKGDIIAHGVLFVPIGYTGSDKVSLEWRISFSVAEKLLINTFSHTQLLCYALMKILLKDIINRDRDCKDLLCSYFIKTIILWVSEEWTEWKPENLIQCFLRCLRRLLYCVKYSMCPHYFIPIINMFENKVEGQSRKVLQRYLTTLFGVGWRCVLFSEQFHNFTLHSNEIVLTSEIKRIQLQVLFKYYKNSIQQMIHWTHAMPVYRRLIRFISIRKSSFIKANYCRCLSVVSARLIDSSTFDLSEINKKVYSQNRTQISYLLQSVNHDAVSGWLMLATFFYKRKQYKDVLYILDHVIIKCIPEKLNIAERLSLELKFIKSTTLQSLGIMRVFKLLLLYNLVLMPESKLIPEELQLHFFQTPLILPPVEFAHFLCFLCHFHLNDKLNCSKSILELVLTLKKNHFIQPPICLGMAQKLLGIALELTGQKGLSVLAFENALECFNFKELSMVYMAYENHK